MNEYDSGKMHDVLEAAHGMVRTEDPAQADVLLVNTCSVREKAQEKVFSLLGEWRRYKEERPHVVIGVGGCVASQEGEGITARAPYVDLVFGPQTLHRLPEMLRGLKQTGRAQIDVSFPEIEKFDRLPEPRAEGAAAFVSIMEGCSKYCTFCVVPYTRGEEISRPFEQVLAEVRALANRGVSEVTLLGQNVNAYAGDDGRRRGRRPCDPDPLRRRPSGHRAHSLHHFASARVQRQSDRGLCECPEAQQPPASARAKRLGSHSRRDEARPHRARVQAEIAQAPRGAARHIDHHRHHRRISRRD